MTIHRLPSVVARYLYANTLFALCSSHFLILTFFFLTLCRILPTVLVGADGQTSVSSWSPLARSTETSWRSWASALFSAFATYTCGIPW